MTTGVVVFAIGVLVVVGLFLVGAAVLDRWRARQVEDDAPARATAAEELEERTTEPGEPGRRDTTA